MILKMHKCLKQRENQSDSENKLALQCHQRKKKKLSKVFMFLSPVYWLSERKVTGLDGLLVQQGSALF